VSWLETARPEGWPGIVLERHDLEAKRAGNFSLRKGQDLHLAAA
jgi:hypothetical protein